MSGSIWTMQGSKQCKWSRWADSSVEEDVCICLCSQPSNIRCANHLIQPTTSFICSTNFKLVEQPSFQLRKALKVPMAIVQVIRNARATGIQGGHKLFEDELCSSQSVFVQINLPISLDSPLSHKLDLLQLVWCTIHQTNFKNYGSACATFLLHSSTHPPRCNRIILAISK